MGKFYGVIIFITALFASSVSQQNAATEQEAELAPFILIGERHGIAEQQLMIAALLNEISKSGKKVAVVIEMINTDQNELLQTFRALSPENPQDLQHAIEWNKTGWPDFSNYAPIFEVIWARDMLILPGDPAAEDINRWRRGEYAATDPKPEQFLVNRQSAETANLIEGSWATSMQTAHCDQLAPLDAKTLGRMQMMRDAFMANQIRSALAAGADHVILIAGRAHIRRDRGVPVYLNAPEDTQNIAIIETDPNEAENETYQPDKIASDAVLPYDQIILTAPLAETETACDRLRRKGLIE